jgi:hypothetical protein
MKTTTANLDDREAAMTVLLAVTEAWLAAKTNGDRDREADMLALQDRVIDHLLSLR